MQTEFYDQAVPRGADLLDEKIPGWYDLVDITTLNVVYYGSCVFGQIKNSLFSHLPSRGRVYALSGSLGITPYSASYGFDAVPEDVDPSTTAPYDYLTDLWRDEIQQRRLRDARAKTTHETLIAVTGG